MKLLSATNRYYIASISVFFFLAGVLLFYFIRYHLKDELDEQLRTEQAHVLGAISDLDSLHTSSLDFNDNLSFVKTKPNNRIEPILFDSLLYESIEKEIVPYRLIRFTANTKNQNYIVTIKFSEIETEDIIQSISVSLMLVFGLFSATLYFTNYYFSKKLWSPFLRTISAIKTINISSKDSSLELDKTSIEEFNELNDSLKQMVERIKSDYQRMKDFSENASHELQTPLTVIRSKLECLLQSKDLRADDAHLINQALEHTIRLSRINQTLLLLTKIENGQYDQKQEISFSKIFEKYLEVYNEIVSGKQLTVTVKQNKDFIFNMHPAIADILVSNLVSNAVKHNIDSGFIFLDFNKNGIEISNSGEAPKYPANLLFNRFTKGTHSSEHLGLGLALVKEIIVSCGLHIQYRYTENCHKILIQ